MKHPAQRWWLDPLLWLALLAACVYWMLLYVVMRPGIDPGWPLDAPRAFIYPALVYPVLEEIVFRGFIQDFLQRRMQHRRLGVLSHANIITSLVFTALHFLSHPPLWAVAVFVPSLVFGYFKDRTGALGAPIMLHVFYNSGYFLLFTRP